VKRLKNGLPTSRHEHVFAKADAMLVDAAEIDVVRCAEGGWLPAYGKPRYGTIQGRHFVVGGRRAMEFKTYAEACHARDNLKGLFR
jgi:hypothetical protein